MTEPIWSPTPEVLERANVVRLMRRHGFETYAELLRRSQEEPEWFWPAVVEDLGLEFFEPWKRVVDVSRGSWSVARYSFGEMLARASADVHVRPGEILGSGTLGTGCLLEVKDATLGRWLEPGDLVTLAGDRLGRLETPIVVRPTP